MNDKWVVADWHLGEDRFDIMQRPFKDATSHVNHIIEKHNEVVKPDDYVYVIGDVLYQKADPLVWLSYVGKMNGRKSLIRGNHDIPFSDEQFKPYFEEIIPNGGGLSMIIEGINCYMTHYPSTGVKDAFNLVGHIHGAWKFQLNSLNVGVDANHFYPTNFTRIPFYLTAISQYYDRDVWAAYADINESYRDTRGKKTSYYDTIKPV